MLFFVLFILIHVFLVFSTGALRNLNHMFGGTGRGELGRVLAICGRNRHHGGRVAPRSPARPPVFAPTAKLFGHVSSR
jgi:hypothetical protein